MSGGKVLSSEEIDALRRQAIDLAEVGNRDAAWDAVAPLLKAQTHDEHAAKALINIVGLDCMSPEHALAALETIEASYSDNVVIISQIAENLDKAVDINFLNAAPLDHPLFHRAIGYLERKWTQGKYNNETELLNGLATAARIFGRQKDAVAEQAYKRLIELDPDTHYRHYNFGLFLKTRARFEEGMLANQRAAALSKKPSEATQWNLGICATGAGRGEVALNTWKGLGHKIEMGRFDLPDGRFPDCKIRLAERPLAERSETTDDPGEEETIWIERLSACHGIIRSVLHCDLGVNYGDVVLFDGAPITHHKYDDVEVPVFPHLATLLRRNYQIFDFAGTQDKPDRLADVSRALKADAVVYSHTDSFNVLCATCWNDPAINHARHERITKHVVTGKIAAPPDMAPRELLSQLDAGMKDMAPCQIYSPELCGAAGLSERADVEQRRFEMLKNN